MNSSNDAFECSSTTLLNEAISREHAITRADADALLGRLDRERWLHKDSRGYYSLGVRAVAELKQYLKDEFPDQMRDCALCHDAVCRGETCEQPECMTRLHARCRFRRHRSTEAKCPTCGAVWPNQVRL